MQPKLFGNRLRCRSSLNLFIGRSRRTNYRNIQIIYNIRQAPPDCLFSKSRVAETLEGIWKRIDRCERVAERAKKL